MTHLSEEQIVDLYYGEGTSEAGKHVAVCRTCAAEYARLEQSLNAITAVEIPRKGEDFSEQVWQSLKPQLIPYEMKRAGWFSWTKWRSASVAVVCIVLLATVFVGGRYWERFTAKKDTVATNQHTAQRVVVVVLTDHLDRTERLLVQLEHANGDDPAQNALMQSEAQQLLASNRLYRQSVSYSSDPALAGMLERLEGILAEMANDPKLTQADLERLRKEANSKGILFEIRVMLAHIPDKKSGQEPTKGATSI
ncbi:MAG TPA: hypothetical protein VG844_10665 [Terracidiphilus sp.]|nr:hypothetical protein [Terracidiphilus sp.]